MSLDPDDEIELLVPQVAQRRPSFMLQCSVPGPTSSAWIRVPAQPVRFPQRDPAVLLNRDCSRQYSLIGVIVYQGVL